MKLVLLSGGSGKRLWPLSNDARSKQFLKVLADENNNQVSMVQRVYSQIEKVGLGASTVIATSASQVDILRNQLGSEVSIVVEPERRDTFPAIALSASYLYSECNTKLDEVVAILPVDPYVDDAFFETVAQLKEVISNSDADLALIGVKPTFPSSKYGYIVPKEEEKSAYKRVKNFKEKPSEAQAQALIEKGALWNCGVFAFRLSFLINVINSLGLPTNYSDLLSQYKQFNKNSFDYEIVEKAKDIVVLPYDGYWKDLGTWNTLTEEIASNILGLGTISKDSKDVHLVNELEIPVVVLGAKNLIVAASPDGILVSDKNASPKLKELIQNFDNRPMYEECIWGWYKVLDFSKSTNGLEVLTKKVCIKEGKSLSYIYHEYKSGIWTVLKGKGEVIINNNIRDIGAGDVIEVLPYVKHSIRSLEELEIIEVQRGHNNIEDGINEPILTLGNKINSVGIK